MENNLKPQYENLRKKYPLPDFERLDFDFEISDIDETNFLLREIRRGMSEKLDSAIKVLDGVLQPDTSSFTQLHECRFFDDAEKNLAFVLFKKLNILYKSSLILEISPDDKKEAEFISTVFREWQGIKEDLSKIINKLKESWGIDTSYHEDLGYLG